MLYFLRLLLPLLIVFVLIAVVLYIIHYSVFIGIKDNLISSFQYRQLMAARNTAHNLSSTINYIIMDIKSQAEESGTRLSPHTTETTSVLRAMYKRHLDVAYHAGLIIIEPDAPLATIAHVYPESRAAVSEGNEITYQAHIQRMLNNPGDTIVSEPFDAVQGFRAIAIHQPIIDPEGGELIASLAMLLRFKELFAELFAASRIGPQGTTLLLDDKGTILYHDDEQLWGKNWMNYIEPLGEDKRQWLESKSSKFDALFNKSPRGQNYHIVRDLVSGARTYFSSSAVALGDKIYWIVVANPEDDVVGTLKSYKEAISNSTAVIFMVYTMLILLVFFSSYGSMRAKERAKMVDELERKVDQRTKELQKAQQQLQTYSSDLEKLVEERTNALIQSEGKYTALFQNAKEAIILTDAKTGQILDCNPEAERLFGYSLNELMDKKVWELGHPQVKEIARKRFYEFVSVGYGNVPEVPIRSKDDRVFYVDLICKDFRYADRDFFLFLLWDATEQKKARQELHRTNIALNERVKHLTCLHNINQEIEKEFTPIEFLRRAAKHIEATITTEGNLGAYIEFDSKQIEILAPQDEFHDRKNYPIVVGQQRRGNLVIYYKEGDTIDLWEENLFSDIARLISHAIGKYEVELQLQEYSHNLEAMVEEKTRELKAKNKDLETFAYTISHDLKVPLVPIMGFASLLKEEHSEQLDEEGLMLVERIYYNASWMERMITDLLELSRAGVKRTDLREIEVEEVLNEVTAFLEEQLKEKNIQVRKQSELGSVVFDKTQLYQIFANLIGNAVKFTKPAEEGTEQPFILIWGEEKEDKKLFCVSDNGIGIPKEHQARIFDVFLQSKVKRDTSGTGVGLSIVKRILESYGGEIWVESEPGKGSSFFFTIPKMKA